MRTGLTSRTKQARRCGPSLNKGTVCSKDKFIFPLHKLQRLSEIPKMDAFQPQIFRAPVSSKHLVLINYFLCCSQPLYEVRYYFPYFTNEETEAQRCVIINLRLINCRVGFKPSLDFCPTSPCPRTLSSSNILNPRSSWPWEALSLACGKAGCGPQEGKLKDSPGNLICSVRGKMERWAFVQKSLRIQDHHSRELNPAKVPVSLGSRAGHRPADLAAWMCPLIPGRSTGRRVTWCWRKAGWFLFLFLFFFFKKFTVYF